MNHFLFLTNIFFLVDFEGSNFSAASIVMFVDIEVALFMSVIRGFTSLKLCSLNEVIFLMNPESKVISKINKKNCRVFLGLYTKRLK